MAALPPMSAPVPCIARSPRPDGQRSTSAARSEPLSMPVTPPPSSEPVALRAAPSGPVWRVLPGGRRGRGATRARAARGGAGGEGWGGVLGPPRRARELRRVGAPGSLWVVAPGGSPPVSAPVARTPGSLLLAAALA